MTDRTVPMDIRIIGYDDLPAANSGPLPLTTIRQDIALGTEKMADTLFARMAGDASVSIIMEPQLVVRLST